MDCLLASDGGGLLRAWLILAAAGVLIALIPPAAGQAHSFSDLRAWISEWSAQAEVGLTAELLDELSDMRGRHPSSFDQAAQNRPYAPKAGPAPAGSGMGPGGPAVEAWRPLVGEFFAAADVDRALCLMTYESGGNPNAFNSSSGASGLMQVLDDWADDYGVAPADLFIPSVNLSIAADLRARFGWTQWSPYNRGLCR